MTKPAKPPVRFGVRTLEDLRVRCLIDEITKCWTYQLRKAPDRHRTWSANIWMSDLQKSETLQRAAWLLAHGKLGTARDWNVWRTCGNQMCCNPAHLKAGPRRQMGAWQAQDGSLRGDPVRSAINRRAKINSASTLLTYELADWIKESAQSGLAVAHALAVSPQTVSRVRLGQSWVRTVQAASVFSWASLGAR